MGRYISLQYQKQVSTSEYAKLRVAEKSKQRRKITLKNFASKRLQFYQMSQIHRSFQILEPPLRI